jgi:hypothetical protein
MSNHCFLLTYTVKTRDNSYSSQEKTDFVRQEMSEIDCWVKLSNVETTFSGYFNLDETIKCNKKNEAKEKIILKIKSILNKYDAFYEVDVQCAIMVEGLGEPISFYV